MLRHWGPAAAWAIAISIFSTTLFSASNTSRWIFPFLQWLLPGASWPTIFAVHDAIRKASHFVEYFILSVLVLRGFRGDGRGWRVAWAIYTVALIAGYSALDELHQAFVPTRRGSPWDVLIDTVGGTAAQILLWWKHRI
jgi:hypothetical protein